VADVIDSVRTVGTETGTSEEAEVVAQSLEAGFQRIRDAVAGLPRPKVAFLEWTGVSLLLTNKETY
jgi:ABC-type Fe3+-hydroxamate transport system substrate-binding protein